jgi:hypothetical protein
MCSVAATSLSLGIAQADVQEGYVLYSSISSQDTVLIDDDGNVQQTWTGADSPASTAYLFQGGTLLRPCRAPDPQLVGASLGGRIQLIDKDNTILWDYLFSDEFNQQHHDICPMPNGNVLLVAWEKKTASQAQSLGRLSPEEMWPTQIVEVRQNGLTTGEIVWEWHFWDHLIQDVNPLLPNYGVVADHPERVDINTENVTNGDWIHVNGIDYNPELDQIVFSSNRLDEIFIIDHSTTTEEARGSTGGNSGMGGDFLYRWGNTYNYDRGAVTDQILFNVHGVNWIDSGLPGAGNILLYNNGIDQGRSELIEFTPPMLSNGTYQLNGTLSYNPAEGDYEWFYTSTDFFSGRLSGVYRLPNGNSMASVGGTGEIREVTADGSIAWSFQTGSSLMKANRYPLDIMQEACCDGDIDCNGVINGADLTILLGSWGLAVNDLTGDGVVSGADLSIILSRWGACN